MNARLRLTREAGALFLVGPSTSIERPRQVAFVMLMRRYAGEPVGIECRNAAGTQWAFVAPNIKNSQEQRDWRIQRFDANGFLSHSCHNTIVEAVEDLIHSGFLTVDEGALERCSSTKAWDVGLRCQQARDRHNRGEISYAQMIERFGVSA